MACCFRTTSMQLQKEKTYKWSVWRRFSEFEALDRCGARCSIGGSLRSVT